MVGFAERLRRLPDAGPGSRKTAAPVALTMPEDRAGQIDALKRLIAAVQKKPPGPPVVTQERLEGRLGVDDGRQLVGERLDDGFGTYFRQVHVLEPHHCHGTIPVRSALEACPQMIAKLALDAKLASIDLSGALFLDTETTGLSMGAGTVPFLIGVAWFEDESLVIEQLLLENLGEESPMLRRLHALVERSTCIVTYNGKSYDWPLICSRFVMNRVSPPPDRPHVDLLHMARRVFRPRLGAARLVMMEEMVLGMRRERDIDGAEIPGVYWSFLRHKNSAVLSLVMEHNANDLVALAALLAVLSERIENVHHGDDPIDHLAIAKVAVRAKDFERALSFAAAAAEGGGTEEVTSDAELLRGDLLKRFAEYEGACAAYDAAVEAAGRDRLRAARAHLALAKLWEHRFKRFDRALYHAQHTAPLESADEQTRRRARLDKRIARAAIAPKKSRRRARAA
ncbi:MAG: ribonuclease H-like domain-containing protein [Deltaproteobacteria bacterium]|jgi:uncharacterized protein YprB with RNaseH-like and TPR domain